MNEKIAKIIKSSEFAPSLLRGVLVVILLFIFFLTPSFEPGPNLAVFLATLAIVILSVLSAHYSEKRAELVEDQNDLIESQATALERIEAQAEKQTELLRELNNALDVIESGMVEGEAQKERQKEEEAKE